MGERRNDTRRGGGGTEWTELDMGCWKLRRGKAGRWKVDWEGGIERDGESEEAERDEEGGKSKVIWELQGTVGR